VGNSNVAAELLLQGTFHLKSFKFVTVPSFRSAFKIYQSINLHLEHDLGQPFQSWYDLIEDDLPTTPQPVLVPSTSSTPYPSGFMSDMRNLLQPNLGVTGFGFDPLLRGEPPHQPVLLEQRNTPFIYLRPSGFLGVRVPSRLGA
jgi:hypothetical protein